MAVSIVVGGQYGSEGKGKIAHFLTRHRSASAAVRVGGPNSGHTVYDDSGRKFILRHLPTAAILPDVLCVLAAGSYIDVDRILHEISVTGLPVRRLCIDPHAIVITEQHRVNEHLVGLRADIGSTLTGTGAAVVERAMRTKKVSFAMDHPKLRSYVTETKSLLRELLNTGSRIVIEGTQGYGLSVLHTPHYPYATSRDTTAAGFLSEVGLSPMDVDEVALVIRAFPIRVPGNSGPLPNECSWNDVTMEARAVDRIEEITSVTQAVRRVGRFDPSIVNQAIAANNPTMVFLNHADYWDSECRASGIPSSRVVSMVVDIERMIRRRIDYIGLSEVETVKNSFRNLESRA